MTVRGFEELAVALDADIVGRTRTGLTFTADCPACSDGRILAWTYRPGFRHPGYRCDGGCGRRGDLVGLDLLLRRAAA